MSQVRTLSLALKKLNRKKGVAKLDKHELEKELNEAKDLLEDAMHLLDNLHGGDYETYSEIRRFLYGSDD